MKDNRYNIYFGTNETGNIFDYREPAIVFWPTTDEWNDFGLKTRFGFKLVVNNDVRISGEVHLAFIKNEGKEENPVEMVLAAVQKARTQFISASDLPTFFSMQPNMEAYRQIVKKCGVDEGEDLLLAINDLVALKQIQRLPAWYEAATHSRCFKLSFTRRGESFFAFHNAGSILSGLESETIQGLTENYRLEFKLPAFGNNHVIDFNFQHDDELPKRIAIMIGKNGVGKSQSLSFFAKSFLSRKRTSSQQPLLVDGDGDRPRINRLLAISSPGETSKTFPPCRKKRHVDYYRIFLSRSFNGYRQSGLGEALVRLVRSDEAIRGKDRWNLFCDAVSVVAPINELVVKIDRSSDGIDSMPIVRNELLPLSEMRQRAAEQHLDLLGDIDSNSDVYRLTDGQEYPLSSGQLTFIRFAAHACLHIENGTMVLIDEPETHFHPNYISDFVRLLDRLLSETGSFAILATHSAYFVREVARTQVTVLRLNKSKMIEVLRPRLRTLGADVGEISQFVFEDAGFGFLLEQIRQQIKRDKIRAANLLQAVEGEIAPEAWMDLKREIQGQEIQK